MAKPKPAKRSEHRTGTKASRARGKHGRTFCKRCLKKISAGRQFCNTHCAVLYTYGYEATDAQKRNAPNAV